jgi:hypothetical protein
VDGKTWKLDVTIYDRPGWTCAAWGNPPIKRENNELVIGFQAQVEDEIIDDFYVGHTEPVFLSSKNAGKSWERITREDAGVDPDNLWPVRLSDGTLITVQTDVPTKQAQKERLEKLGLGYLWHPDSEFGWDLWPASYAEKLKQQGVAVFEQKGPALPSGTVATHNRPLVTNISHDGGRTWEKRPMEGLPKFGHLVGWTPKIALPDGTVVGAIYGQVIGKDKAGWGSASVYAIRSTDRGQTWQLSPIAHDPTGKHFFNETDLLLLPSGRILALIRCESKEVHLYQSYSDDGGVSWSPPAPTPIPGAPVHLLQLKSGNILCAYRAIGALGRERGYSGYPVGFHAVLSRDEGKTWDVANEKIIRDDTLPGLVGYPSSAQLDDGTIFTLYNVVRVGRIKPGDNFGYKEVLTVHHPLHCYIAGSIYTEDYTRPLG